MHDTCLKLSREPEHQACPRSGVTAADNYLIRVLETEFRTSARTINVPHHCVNPSVLRVVLYKISVIHK